MAVVKSWEPPQQRSCSVSFSGGKLERTYTRVYRFRCSDPNDNESTIEADVSCPAIGSLLAGTLAYCRQKEIKEIEPGPTPVWECSATFSTQAFEYPWYPYKPALWSGSSGRKDVPVVRDLDGKAVLNTAKDIYDPTPTAEFPIFSESLAVSLHSSDFDGGWLAQYNLAVNSSSFRGWAKGQALVSEVGYQQNIFEDEDGNEELYYDVSIRFDYDGSEKGWQPHLLSQGMRELSGGTLKPIRIKGAEITSPVCLGSSGQKLLGDAAATGAVFTPYKFYHERDLSPLNFT